MLSTIKEKVFLTFQALFPAEMYQMSQAAVTASEKNAVGVKMLLNGLLWKF